MLLHHCPVGQTLGSRDKDCIIKTEEGVHTGNNDKKFWCNLLRVLCAEPPLHHPPVCVPAAGQPSHWVSLL